MYKILTRRGVLKVNKRKKPKFQVGDIVVMMLYGIVGAVTNVKELEQTFTYEIDGKTGSYLESSLIHLDEFNENYSEHEHISVDYRFYFDDLVQVPNISKDIYKVVGFRTEIWRYKNESWEDVIYELARVRDGDWLECSEEEVTLVCEAKNAEQFLKKFAETNPGMGLKKLPKKNKKSPISKEIVVKPLTELQKKERIDNLLDLYFDYVSLKHNFGDGEFDKVIALIIKKLHELTGINNATL